jgi:hypothetical protein
MSLQERIRQRVEALAADLASGLGGQLKAAADELAAVAAEERVATEAEAMARFADDLANAREEAERATQQAVKQARDEAERATHEAVRRTRAEIEQRLGAELQHARAQIDGLTEDAARLVADAERHKGDADRHKADAERHKADAERHKAESERHKTDAEKARKELAYAQGEAQRLKRETEQLRVAGEQLKATLSERARDTAARDAAERASAVERESSLALLDRLVSSVRRIDAANALTDVLGALATGAAAETARVALLLAAPPAEGASSQPLQAWRLSGFPAPPAAFDIPLASAGDLARTGLPFAPLAKNRAGLALPIQVGGQTVAVLYADDGTAEHASPAPWPEAIEVLARHAAARLEVVTAARTAQVLGVHPVATTGSRVTPAEDEPGARRYAKLLVSEIKLYNESAVRLGREHRDIYDRLRPEIERARRLFEERVPPHVAGRQRYFDDELVQTLADGDASRLGIVSK